jgi:hypothetical protein
MTRRLALVAVLAALALAGAGVALWGRGGGAPEGAIPVPSGRTVVLQDVIANSPGAEGMVTRFRFVAPGLTATDDLETALTDMEHLCTTYALPRLAPPLPAQVVISLAAAPVPFGEAAPDVVQMFESYRIEGAACLWEMF